MLVTVSLKVSFEYNLIDILFSRFSVNCLKHGGFMTTLQCCMFVEKDHSTTILMKEAIMLFNCG